jgi:hypothetical protein
MIQKTTFLAACFGTMLFGGFCGFRTGSAFEVARQAREAPEPPVVDTGSTVGYVRQLKSLSSNDVFNAPDISPDITDQRPACKNWQVKLAPFDPALADQTVTLSLRDGKDGEDQRQQLLDTLFEHRGVIVGFNQVAHRDCQGGTDYVIARVTDAGPAPPAAKAPGFKK